MRASELVLIASITLFSVVICVQSLEFRYLSPQGFGPAFVPLNFAALSVILGLLMVAKAWRRKSDDDMADRLIDRAKSTIPAIAAAAMLFAATYLMHLGSVFAPLYAVMIVVSLTMLGHSLVRALVLNAAALAVIYGIFNLWLDIPVT